MKIVKILFSLLMVLSQAADWRAGFYVGRWKPELNCPKTYITIRFINFHKALDLFRNGQFKSINWLWLVNTRYHVLKSSNCFSSAESHVGYHGSQVGSTTYQLRLPQQMVYEWYKLLSICWRACLFYLMITHINQCYALCFFMCVSILCWKNEKKYCLSM
jgi:hypothetical protein